MFIVDSQVHIWAAETPERPWIADAAKPQRDVPLEPAELLLEMKNAGVQRAILVPPKSWDANRNDLVLKAAQQHPERFAAMGLLDIEAPEARRHLAGWRQQPGMLGLRCSFNKHRPASLFNAGQIDWLWEEAEVAAVPIMLMVTPDQLPALGKIAERHPNLKLILDHLALPSNKMDDEAFREFDQLLRAAKWPNVAVKVSALPVYTRDCYPYFSVHSYIRKVYDAFGPKRMLWGSDLTRLPCSYRQAVTMFTEEIQWLSLDDKKWIMGAALCEWLGWEVQIELGK